MLTSAAWRHHGPAAVVKVQNTQGHPLAYIQAEYRVSISRTGCSRDRPLRKHSESKQQQRDYYSQKKDQLVVAPALLIGEAFAAFSGSLFVPRAEAADRPVTLVLRL